MGVAVVQESEMHFSRPRLPSKCDQARQWLTLELDGELSSFERALFEAHVTSCSECASYAEHVRSYTTALRATALEPLAHPIALPSSSRRRLRAPQVLATAAAAVAVTVGAVALSGSVGDGSLADRVTPVRGVSVDEEIDELKVRQFEVLEERLALARPKPIPAGRQPV